MSGSRTTSAARCICAGTKKDGSPCSRVLTNGRKYCHNHVSVSVIKTIPISLRDDDCDTDPTPEPTVPVDDKRNDRFIECMNVLNDKLCKATISKDYAMINTIVVSMTNVTKSL